MVKQLFVLAALLVLNTGCAQDAKQAGQPAAAARQSDPIYAYVDQARADLSKGKVDLINEVMQLSPAESAKFWPIYRNYEKELATLGDQRVEMTKTFVRAFSDKTLNDQTAGTLSDQWFKFENQRLDLLQKYYKRIADEVSPVRAAQFVQIENRVGMVVDISLASQLPLIDTPTRHEP